MNQYDIIVIGAGLYGIAAARYYLEVHPDSKVLILESSHIIGGPWSTERIYPEFWTQTPLGMAEFSDVPLQLPLNEETYHGFFPASHVSNYLEEYVDSHVYHGKSLRDRILFRYRVTSIENLNTGEWSVSCDSRPDKFIASKVAVASGLTSTPNEPSLPNRSAFSGQIIHQKAFGASSCLDCSQIADVAVVGAGKSAADVVYASAKAGKHVSWIIRENGNGPAAQMPATGRGPYDNPISLFSTRMAASFSPSIFAAESIWSRILHRTRIGRRIVDWVWDSADKQSCTSAGYKTRKAAKQGFEKLEPETSIFWQSQGSGICQHPDFWQVVADNVDVYRADIVSLHPRALELSNTLSVAADIIICATGWQSSFSFLTAQQKASLGLPVYLSEESPADAAKWKDLDVAAEEHVVHLFPRLKNVPFSIQEREETPYRLYKNMAPVNDHDHRILFLGCLQLGNHFMTAEAQALWAVAYFDGRLDLPMKNEMEVQLANKNAWCRLRYPTKGWDGSFFFFDSLLYAVALLDEIGLRSFRRSWPMSEVVTVKARNFRNLVSEYIARA